MSDTIHFLSDTITSPVPAPATCPPPPATMPPTGALADNGATENSKLMIVDDEAINIAFVKKYLAEAGYRRFVTLSDPTQVIDTFLREQPDAVILDINMPAVGGLEILDRIRNQLQLVHIPVLILTAEEDERVRQRAISLGATDFLHKPVVLTELVPRVRNALMLKRYHDRMRSYAQDLEHEVRKRTAELAASRLELIHCLARAAEYRDNETGRHVIRVGRYAGLIAHKLELDPSQVELIEHAAPLHDMGKIAMPDSILLKNGALSPEEMDIMQRHTTYGKRTFEPMSRDEYRALKSHTFLGEMILDVASSPIMTMAAEISLTHHERWDGKGYPLGLAGKEIPLPGRIVAVADVFDALSNKRPYKPAFPMEKCYAIMEEGRGTQFDPRVLDAFLACREETLQIRIEFADVE